MKNSTKYFTVVFAVIIALIISPQAGGAINPHPTPLKKYCFEIAYTKEQIEGVPTKILHDEILRAAEEIVPSSLLEKTPVGLKFFEGKNSMIDACLYYEDD